MTKILLISLSLLLPLLFNACSKFATLEPGITIDNSSESPPSLVAFSNTLFPVLQQNCKQCHGQSQHPRFAVANHEEAHEVIKAQKLVDLSTPQNSRFIAKLKGGHQGFREEVITQFVDSITLWSQASDTLPDEVVDNDEPVNEAPPLPFEPSNAFSGHKQILGGKIVRAYLK